jgi:hypothetical protein
MVELLDVVEDEYLFMSSMIAANQSAVNSDLEIFLREDRKDGRRAAGTASPIGRCVRGTKVQEDAMLRWAVPLACVGTALAAVVSACVMCP